MTNKDLLAHSAQMRCLRELTRETKEQEKDNNKKDK